MKFYTFEISHAFESKYGGGGVYQTCASRKILNFAHPVRRQKHKEAIFWPIHTTTPSRI